MEAWVSCQGCPTCDYHHRREILHGCYHETSHVLDLLCLNPHESRDEQVGGRRCAEWICQRLRQATCLKGRWPGRRWSHDRHHAGVRLCRPSWRSRRCGSRCPVRRRQYMTIAHPAARCTYRLAGGGQDLAISTHLQGPQRCGVCRDDADISLYHLDQLYLTGGATWKCQYSRIETA